MAIAALLPVLERRLQRARAHWIEQENRARRCMEHLAQADQRLAIVQDTFNDATLAFQGAQSKPQLPGRMAADLNGLQVRQRQLDEAIDERRLADQAVQAALLSMYEARQHHAALARRCQAVRERVEQMLREESKRRDLQTQAAQDEDWSAAHARRECRNL